MTRRVQEVQKGVIASQWLSFRGPCWARALPVALRVREGTTYVDDGRAGWAR